MPAETPVREVMSAPVETVETDATVAEIARRFATEGIGSLIIGEDPIRGIVTEFDVVAAVGEGEDPETTTVAEVMSEPVVTIRPHESVETAGERMGNNGVKKLPVTEDGRPVGIVTTTDLAFFLPHHRLEMASQPEADVPDGEFE
ncbi:MAG: cyclic nucleotide-binding/CBS domain-containing protein [Haloarculaceae archaeon]